MKRTEMPANVREWWERVFLAAIAGCPPQPWGPNDTCRWAERVADESCRRRYGVPLEEDR